MFSFIYRNLSILVTITTIFTYCYPLSQAHAGGRGKRDRPPNLDDPHNGGPAKRPGMLTTHRRPPGQSSAQTDSRQPRNEVRAAAAGPRGCFAALSISTLDRAMTAFSSNLFQQLTEAELHQNLLLAGPSAHMALALAYLGAGPRGDNRAQLAKALHFTDPPQATQYTMIAELIHSFLQDFPTAVPGNDQQMILTAANALFARDDVKFKPGFLELARTMGAYTARANFTGPLGVAALAAMNKWVSDSTGGKIPSILSELIPDDFLVLLSTLYLKGLWLNPFPKDQNEQTRFSPITGSPITVTMMNQINYFRHYEDSDGDVQILELPIHGPKFKDSSQSESYRYSVYVVLPASNAIFDFTLTGATHEWLETHIQKMALEYGRVAIPKFRIGADLDLIPALKSLGVTAAFGGGDFSSMTDGPAFLSKVKQRTVGEFNEGGIEAAGATAVVGTLRSAISGEMPTFIFRAEHPFLFFVRDNQKRAILFDGAVHHPQYPTEN